MRRKSYHGRREGLQLFRIKNRLDMEMALAHFTECKERELLRNRIGNTLDILSEAYGEMRSSRDMGGYVFLFETLDSYANNIEQIMNYYRLDSNDAEYTDYLGECNGRKWEEQLFLLSSGEDSMVFVYPLLIK